MTKDLAAFCKRDLHELAWVETGRAIGHDLTRFNLSLAGQAARVCVVEGFNERWSRAHKPDVSTRFERQWVRLRLNAFVRQRVADTAMTPAFLESIDVVHCPVLRIKLTHAAQASTDWSVDRLNNDGAYAPGNLAVMSTAANTAKSGRSFKEVLSLASQQTVTA